MSNTIRIKRRANGGGAGAPTTLANAELAFNEQTNVLYYGTGTGGTGGSATSIIPIGGNGAFVDTSSAQTVGGAKTFSSTITGSVSGNAGTATALSTARNIALSGDATGTASFDGSANATIAITKGMGVFKRQMQFCNSPDNIFMTFCVVGHQHLFKSTQNFLWSRSNIISNSHKFIFFSEPARNFITNIGNQHFVK